MAQFQAVAGVGAFLTGAYYWSKTTFAPSEPFTRPAPAAEDGSLAGTTSTTLMNRAFVFIKPHAVTTDVEELVRKDLAGRGITVLNEGEVSSEKIDEKKFIDQHYYAIASKATMTKAADLPVPSDKFQSAFGESWESALSNNRAFNALDACKELGIDAPKMTELWATATKEQRVTKFGGGFYCGEINYEGKKVYVFNAFFMRMRNQYTAPGLKIHWFDVQWNPAELAWEDFRGKVLGPTDPKQAPADSLRGKILIDWKKLGLDREPNIATGENSVHASASPFEGLAERMNWLGAKCDKDAYCSAMKAAGITEKMIQDWTVDPQVKIEGDKKKSLFDSLEDMDADVCLKRAKELSALQ